MLLEAKDIRVSFRKENQTRLFGRERQEVLHGLSIDLKEGECLGIIGESGSGKSTFGRVLCGLLAPDSGTVRLDGLDLYGRLSTKRAFSRAFPLFFRITPLRPIRAFAYRALLGNPSAPCA